MMKQLRIISLVSIIGAIGCIAPLHHEKRTFYRMDEPVDVTVVTRLKGKALDSVWQRVDSLLAFWEQHYSQLDPKSEIRAINERRVHAVAVSPVLGHMLVQALAYSDTTHGSYDITVGPLKDLWGLGEKPTPQRVPSAESLAKVVDHIGFRHVSVGSSFDTVSIDDSMTRIDAGGFAKGYALMETGRLLRKLGFESYLVAAGDIVSSGRRFDGKPWRIGIQHPRKPDVLMAVVELDSGAVFTSGDYERFWMNGNKRVHHIFDPKTGYSCLTNQSLTIWSPDVLQAKFLSTGLFCLPADSIIAFVKKRGIECLVVDSTGKVTISEGWKSKVKMVN